MEEEEKDASTLLRVLAGHYCRQDLKCMEGTRRVDLCELPHLASGLLCHL